MTQTTFTDNVLIDGSQDIEQLRVQGHTTQDDPLQTWEDSDENVLAQITGDGRLQIGDDLGMATPDAFIEAHRDETSTTKPKRGIHSLGQLSGALNEAVQWLVAELELYGSSAIDAIHTALRIRISNLNTGTPDAGAELRGADIEVINDASAGTAALPKATGLQVGINNATGKTITEAVGLQVQIDNEGTITNPYAIYANAGISHLSDALELKLLAEEADDPPEDFIRIYPKMDGDTPRLYGKLPGEDETVLGGGEIPAGTIWLYGGAAAPFNWLLCDGQAVSRTTYDDLYAVLGDAYLAQAKLTSRTSDTEGVLTFADANHGLAVSGATLTLRWYKQATISSIDTGTDVITTSANHEFSTGDRVKLSATDTLPGGLSWGTDYYVRSVSATTLSLHPTASDANNNTNKINITDAGGGTIRILAQDASSRSGMSISTVSSSQVTVSTGSGSNLPPVNTTLTAECASGMFFLPDLRGRAPIGAGQGMGLTNRVLGTGIGEETQTLSVAEMPSHSHTVQTQQAGGASTAGTISKSTHLRLPEATSSVGGSQPHNNLPPSLPVNYIIKT